MSRALRAIHEAIALDPEISLAWAYKSYFHNIISIFCASNLAASELDMALSAALKAIELDPSLAEVYAVLCQYRVMRGDWIEAELAYHKAHD